MSARTRSSSGNIWPASSRSNSARRGRSPSAAAPAAPAFPASTPRPASARSSPRARSVRSSTARTISSSAASAPTSSIIKGWKADESGNLVFRKTARNFNQPMATAGKICVAEVEEIVPVGSLDPDCIHLPSIYVKRMILGAPYDKKIEFRTDPAEGGGVMRRSRRRRWLLAGCCCAGGAHRRRRRRAARAPPSRRHAMALRLGRGRRVQHPGLSCLPRLCAGDRAAAAARAASCWRRARPSTAPRFLPCGDGRSPWCSTSTRPRSRISATNMTRRSRGRSYDQERWNR